MSRFILDCFGGDNSPAANVEGAVLALNKHKDIHLVLTGDESLIMSELQKHSYDSSRLSVIHAPDVIGCDEKPTEAIKNKKESSLVKALELLRADDSFDGMISIGSTGAVLAGGVLRVGRIRGISRPAFCPILPTMTGGIVGVCDSGANVDCDPRQLYQFAMMGSLYLEKAMGIQAPRVALLNIGVEEGKGDILRKDTYELLRNSPLNFVGNMESRELLTGKCDLVVCDGFSGNVLIKATEGTALEMLKLMKREMTAGFTAKLGALLLKKRMSSIKNLMDYRNHGGSVMLGTKKIIVKGHGSSSAKSVSLCIEQAYNMHVANLCGLFSELAEPSDTLG